MIHVAVDENIDNYLKTYNRLMRVYSISVNGLRCKMIDPVISIYTEHNIMEFKSYWDSDQDSNSSLKYVFDKQQNIFVKLSLHDGELIVIISTY